MYNQMGTWNNNNVHVNQYSNWIITIQNTWNKNNVQLGGGELNNQLSHNVQLSDVVVYNKIHGNVQRTVR